MKFYSLILSVFLVAFAGAKELPWIGVSLESSKMKDREACGLPDGVSLKVVQVASGGPLSKAGGEPGDLWWKLDGQILVNKSQMLVLLQSKSSGDFVEIEYYRKGELKSLNLILSSRERQQVFSVAAQAPDPDASRILAKRERVARVRAGDQDLSLKREGLKWRFEILEKEATILSALVSEGDLSEKVPAKWHGAFLILKSSLAQQSAPAGGASDRRVRYVPLQKSSEK